ncbi:MAG: protoporphyrinogen/coproporphyrinogen oxidase [Phycisphaerae bacterium]
MLAIDFHHAGNGFNGNGRAHAPRILILGAGPTGLGAAYRLKELGYENFHLVDRLPYLGGLAGSFTDDAGFTWDIGGHVMFSHYKYYDDVFDKLMGDDFQMNNRECWVRMFEAWVPYPFQNNIRYLPKEVTFECLSGLVEAQTKRDYKAAGNFREFIDAVFGDGIAKHFMLPYNFKVWAHPAEMMNKEWIGERVAVLDVHRAIKNVVLGTDDFGWGPNNQFKFPLFGGTGEFYRRFEKPLAGHYTLNKTVQRVDPKAKVVHYTDGSREAYDVLVSTMPLDRFCNEIATDIPEPIRTAAAGLKHSGGHMVGIGIKQPCPSTKSWMYFPEANCPFYRVTYLSNYSPHMTPDNATHYSLLCEVSYSEHKPVDASRVVEDVITGLVNAGLITDADRADIVDTWHFQAEYSYPTPSVERDEILAEVIPFLERWDIYSRGRFGMWKYEVSNTDHSLMQGVELVNRLLLGEAESTIGLQYASTDDGRNAADHDDVPADRVRHQRSLHAGSGDPARAVHQQHAAVTPASPYAAQAASLDAPHRGDRPEKRQNPNLSPAAATALTTRSTPANGTAGDLDEADLAEEELGIFQPRNG